MKKASITETKNRLSALLDLVKQGESILITDRNVPIARLEPIPEEGFDKAKMVRLERCGILKRPDSGKRAPLKNNPPKAKGSILKALLAEREESR